MATHSVMISYSEADKPLAEKILRILREREIDCWVAFENIRPGESWPAVISAAIDQCEIFLLILTPHSNGSKQVVRELTQADESDKKLYCFQTEDFTISGDMKFFFSSTQRLMAYRYEFEKALDTMLNDISRLLNIQDAMTDEQEEEISPIDEDEEQEKRAAEREETDWKRAILINAINRYQSFLFMYPDSKYRQRAEERIGKLQAAEEQREKEREEALAVKRKLKMRRWLMVAVGIVIIVAMFFVFKSLLG